MVVAFAEGAVTRLRREFKLLLDAATANAVSERLCASVSPSTTAITSVYFDRPGYPLISRARATPGDCLKIRTKEYFPDEGSRGARVVLEAKRERNGLTQKQRLWINRASLWGLVRQGALWKQLPLVEAGALLPVMAVTYVRDVFQCSASWRVTVDRGVTFHAVTQDLAFGRRRLRSDLLGPPVSRERRVVVEVKHIGDELPPWLAELRSSAATHFSKFAEGMARLERARMNDVQGG